MDVLEPTLPLGSHLNMEGSLNNHCIDNFDSADSGSIIELPCSSNLGRHHNMNAGTRQNWKRSAPCQPLQPKPTNSLHAVSKANRSSKPGTTFEQSSLVESNSIADNEHLNSLNETYDLSTESDDIEEVNAPGGCDEEQWNAGDMYQEDDEVCYEQEEQFNDDDYSIEDQTCEDLYDAPQSVSAVQLSVADHVSNLNELPSTQVSGKGKPMKSLLKINFARTGKNSWAAKSGVRHSPMKKKREQSIGQDISNKKMLVNANIRKNIPKSRFVRKNIRMVIEGTSLDEQTQRAQKEEAERLRRLQETRDLKLRQDDHLVDNTDHLFVNEDATNSCTANHASSLCANKPAVNFDVVEISSDDSDAESGDPVCRSSNNRHRAEADNGEIKANGNSYKLIDEFGRVLVNVGHPRTESDIFLNSRLAARIKPHQIEGVRFLYDNLIESLEHFASTQGLGCILAHSMGLGKTLQVISFVDIFLRCIPNTHSVLIIVPVNTLQNWANEFNMWLPATTGLEETTSVDNYQSPDKSDTSAKSGLRSFNVYTINESIKTLASRASVILKWMSSGGVLLLGYEMFRLLTSEQAGSKRKRFTGSKNCDVIDVDLEDVEMEMTRDMHEALIRPGPDVVICDEGHRIKNCGASISRALKTIRTRRRLVLTGYPLQNNLIEYWCMVDFVRPNYLGSRQEFSNMFERPIVNGQCKDSTASDIRLMRYRSHVLHNLLSGFVQRRGHSVLTLSLPQKEEYVITIRLSPIQRKLYHEFIMQMRTSGLGAWGSSNNPIKAFSVCCKIWNHPDILYQYVNHMEDDVDLDIEESLTRDVLTAVSVKRKRNIPNRAKVNMKSDFEPRDGSKPGLKTISYDWAAEHMQRYRTGNIENGGKMVVLLELIELSVLMGEKILVFSQSILTLNLIEEFLHSQTVPNSNSAWRKNRNYLRIDGTTNSLEREKLINMFNNDDTQGLHVFLLSTRAGCLGINLVSASRVVVFDASWNPCHDCQAVCRVYRYGQSRRSYVYRLIADNTMEHCIYDRQISKQGISDRIVDEMNPQNLLSRRQIDELLRYEYSHYLVVNKDVELPQLNVSGCENMFSDKVLINVMKKHSQWITKMPFKHDSLLLDCKEQKLTNQEKLFAEQSFAMDRRGGRLPDRYAPPMVDYHRFDAFNSGHNSDYPFESYRGPLEPHSSSLFQSVHRGFERQFVPSPPVQSSASDDVIFTGTSYCNRDEDYFSLRKPSFGGLDRLELPQPRLNRSSNILVDLLHSQSPRTLNRQLAMGSRSSGNLDVLPRHANVSDSASSFQSYHRAISSFDRSRMEPLVDQARDSKKLFARHSVSSLNNSSNSLSELSHLINRVDSRTALGAASSSSRFRDELSKPQLNERVIQVRPGVSVRLMRTEKDITLPAPVGESSEAPANHVIPAGETVNIIQTLKDTYLRTRQGRLFTLPRSASHDASPPQWSSGADRDLSLSGDWLMNHCSASMPSPSEVRVRGDDRNSNAYSSNIPEQYSSSTAGFVDRTDTRGGLRRWGGESFVGHAPGGTSMRQLCEETATRESGLRCSSDESTRFPCDGEVFLNVDQSRGDSADCVSVADTRSSAARNAFDGGSRINYFANCDVVDTTDFGFADDADDTNIEHGLLVDQMMLSSRGVGLSVPDVDSSRGSSSRLSQPNGLQRRDASFAQQQGDFPIDYLSDSPESVDNSSTTPMLSDGF